MRLLRIQQKGLLIFALGLSLFLLAMELSILGIIESARFRIIQEKRRQTAKNLSEIGAQYAEAILSKQAALTVPDNIALVYPSSEKTPSEETLYYYWYDSNPVIKSGVFSIHYYVHPNSKNIYRVVSIGSFEGLTYKKTVNIK